MYQKIPHELWAELRHKIPGRWSADCIRFDLGYLFDRQKHYGERVPSCAKLAGTWGVSKTAAYRAIALERSRNGSGTVDLGQTPNIKAEWNGRGTIAERSAICTIYKKEDKEIDLFLACSEMAIGVGAVKRIQPGKGAGRKLSTAIATHGKDVLLAIEAMQTGGPLHWLLEPYTRNGKQSPAAGLPGLLRPTRLPSYIQTAHTWVDQGRPLAAQQTQATGISDRDLYQRAARYIRGGGEMIRTGPQLLSIATAAGIETTKDQCDRVIEKVSSAGGWLQLGRMRIEQVDRYWRG